MTRTSSTTDTLARVPSGTDTLSRRLPAHAQVRFAIRSGAVALALVAWLAGCGGSAPASHTQTTSPASPRAAASLDGPTLASPAPAPPLALPDYQHHQVNLADYRGKAVLVTFIYTHCPDVCPLIVANLHNTLALLGPRARQVKIIGVSVDPKGDTPHAISAFLDAHEMTGKLEYLVSTRAALLPVWRAWGVDASTPDANEQVNHSAMVFGITASGNVVTVYPANFKPADLAHDVPILATS
jgi:protein SCO1